MTVFMILAKDTTACCEVGKVGLIDCEATPDESNHHCLTGQGSSSTCQDPLTWSNII